MYIVCFCYRIVFRPKTMLSSANPTRPYLNIRHKIICFTFEEIDQQCWSRSPTKHACSGLHATPIRVILGLLVVTVDDILHVHVCE